MILSAEADAGARRAALAHALSGCEECEAYLAEAGPELDALLAEAALRGRGEPEGAPLSADENDALFRRVAAQVPAMRADAEVVRPARWRRGLAVGGPLAALAAAAAALLVLAPPGDERASGLPGWTGVKGEGAPEARLTVLLGTRGADGAPVVGDPIADGAEIDRGGVLLFRAAATCTGFPSLVIERVGGRFEVLWQDERRLERGPQTVDRAGTALGFPTDAESGPLTLHLLLADERLTEARAAALVKARLAGTGEAGGCWALDSVRMQVRPEDAR